MNTIGNYTLGRTLGSGVSCKVKKAKGKDGTTVAIKIIKDDERMKELVKAEVNVL
jgi:hypothetical protein